MIYLKKEMSDGTVINTPIYDDEFYCKCPKCGKEFKLSKSMLQMVVNDPMMDFNTSIVCDECCDIHRG